MATIAKPHNPFAHAWYVKINDENYYVINKWFLKTHPNVRLYKNGYCRFYLNQHGVFNLGMVEHNLKADHYDFGIELSFNDFVKYVLNEELYLPKPLNIDRLLTILKFIQNHEKFFT